VDLNPNLPVGRLALCQVCIRFNRPEEVLKNSDAVISLAPRGYSTYMGFAYRGLGHYLAGRYEMARQAMEQAILLNPAFPYPLKDIAIICEKLGLHDEARDALRRLRFAAPSITLASLEAFNLSSIIPPDVAVDMNLVLRKIWDEAPVESSTA
jgi:tetratricopeptide (TPR) repeat protein